eukprot:96075-Rhodomonas_salina.1
MGMGWGGSAGGEGGGSADVALGQGDQGGEVVRQRRSSERARAEGRSIEVVSARLGAGGSVGGG